MCSRCQDSEDTIVWKIYTPHCMHVLLISIIFVDVGVYRVPEQLAKVLWRLDTWVYLERIVV